VVSPSNRRQWLQRESWPASLMGALRVTGTTGAADTSKGKRQGATVLQTVAGPANLMGAVGLTSTTGAAVTTPSMFSYPGEPPDEERVSPNASKYLVTKQVLEATARPAFHRVR
jgi:hypothetical protein